MYKAKVTGTVVCSQKNEQLLGVKLLVVRMIENGAPGKCLVAADATGVAGTGDTVYIIGSKEAAMAFGNMTMPIDAGIVGIITSEQEIKN